MNSQLVVDSTASTPTRVDAAPTAYPTALAVTSMASVQLSDAFSVSVIDRVGAPGTAWLRLSIGAALLLLLVRPRARALGWAQWRSILVLGAASAGLTLSFFAALRRLPFGTAVALEFMGPFAVAALGSRRRHGLRWPVLALTGVTLLTRPWEGSTPLVGVAFALLAAGCWAAYIVWVGHVGAAVPGLAGIAWSMAVAAVCTTPFGVAPAMAQVDPALLLQCVGLAVLLPVLPYALELVVLRRLENHTFATLMCLEPAMASIVGLVVLGQQPVATQATGIALVVAAGVGVMRTTDVRHPPSSGTGRPVVGQW